MSDSALSEAAMLAALRDIRLPADAPGGMVADLAASIGLGALLAVIVLAGLRHVTRKTEKPEAIGDHLQRIETLPPDDARVAYLHLLRQRAPERFADLATRLYRPGGIDLATLEAEARRCD